MREIIIRETEFETAAAAHEYIADNLGFPSYYGKNGSALWDCLSDITIPVRIVMAMRPDAEARVDGFETIVRVLKRAQDILEDVDVVMYVDDLDDEQADQPSGMSAQDALLMLAEGNARFVEAHEHTGDISPARVRHLFANGQRPFATVITCSDSRVPPEHIFMSGLGELFVIRVAGNVVGPLELASAAYAADHLDCKLIVVMGHTHCGAIEAAMEDADHGPVNALAHPIREAIGEERDPYVASMLNVRAGLAALEACPEISALQESGLVLRGAIYHTHSGVVDFL